MPLLALPVETLSQIILYASYAAPTRQKRRLLLLQLARVCKEFSALCLRQIYSKLAYEISPKGAKLLQTLQKVDSKIQYAQFVRALAVRERDGPARRIENSRIVTSMPKGQKAMLNAVIREEEKIAKLLQVVGQHLFELKYETNLLPPIASASTFSLLENLQSLTVVSQAPLIEDVVDREEIFEIATFTLPLPNDTFLSAFKIWRQLRFLDLWKCSFTDFEGVINEGNKPSFHLDSLVLQECVLPAGVLAWLSDSSVKAATLTTLKLTFLGAPSADVQNLIFTSGPLLKVLSFSGDEAVLDGEEVEGREARSCFRNLRRLERLELGGRAITSAHWLSIPSSVFNSSLKSLELDFTPCLSPVDITETLKDTPLASTNLRKVILKGREEIRRRNLRELLRDEEADTSDLTDWLWSRVEFVTFVSLMTARNIQYTADRAIAIGNREEDEEPSSDDEGADDDDAGEFFVTAEQVSNVIMLLIELQARIDFGNLGRSWAQLEEERRIEKEELERTWESGSEY